MFTFIIKYRQPHNHFILASIIIIYNLWTVTSYFLKIFQLPERKIQLLHQYFQSFWWVPRLVDSVTDGFHGWCVLQLLQTDRQYNPLLVIIKNKWSCSVVNIIISCWILLEKSFFTQKFVISYELEDVGPQWAKQNLAKKCLPPQ